VAAYAKRWAQPLHQVDQLGAVDGSRAINIKLAKNLGKIWVFGGIARSANVWPLASFAYSRLARASKFA